MNAKEVPVYPNLEQYKKQAKDLVKARKSGDPETLRRIRQVHPRLGKLSEAEFQGSKFALADAQFIIAREHSFESWPRFAKHLASLNHESSRASLWESAKNAVIKGDVSTLERLLRENAEWFSQRQPPAYVPSGPGPHYGGADARTIIAREHEFESFDEFAKHLEALNRKTSLVSQFESAVDAVISGDLATLERLLRLNPALIRARSMRKHHSTLLHYVGANGVEGFRQKTPRNAVKVAEMLLIAGAEIDAVAEMYGGSTTLGLVATSIHPWLAGVQDALMETLLDHGAAIDQPGAAGNGPSAVNGCLANGRPEAAEFLAARGAPLNLEGAAGVGRLDLVMSFFNEDGSLKANATTVQMKSGFNWACEYGRTGVVDFLLQKGIEVGERHHGETGLHWAALGGHLDIVKLLLERKAPVNVKDERFGGTPLGWALYGWQEGVGAARGRFDEVVALLVAAGATVEVQWLTEESVSADPKMLAALSGKIRS
ncbi:MAG TPA: ankyrin repeat domain-containing protein [Terriglobia bacterium]|nr:ankyrin repeat domain-containing protein [Terriglobia bacterium]